MEGKLKLERYRREEETEVVKERRAESEAVRGFERTGEWQG